MLTLNDDGTATVQLVAVEVVLRRPSIGEYRQLRESIEKLAAVHDELVTTAGAENEEYRLALLERPAEFDRDEWAAKEQRSRDNLRRVQDSADQLRLEWFVEVVHVLGGEDADPETDVTSLVYDARWPAELQRHWRSSPFSPWRDVAPGESPPPPLPIPGVLGEIVPIYHALGSMGISPLEVDRLEIWQVAVLLAYRPPPAPGTSYAAGGIDPYVLARARAGETAEIGHAVVPPRGAGKGGILAGARPAAYVPPEGTGD